MTLNQYTDSLQLNRQPMRKLAVHTPSKDNITQSKQQIDMFLNNRRRIEHLDTFSKDRDSQLTKLKLKKSFESNKTLGEVFQRDIQAKSSKIRNSGMKIQNKEEVKSNKFILSLLLSQLPQQEYPLRKMTSQLKMKLENEVKKTFNPQDFYSQDKINSFFANQLKIRKCNLQQNITPKTLETKDSIFRSKHIMHHPHHFGSLFGKKHKKLTNKEFSLVTIKKYPSSVKPQANMRLYQNCSQEVKKAHLLNIGSRGIANNQNQANSKSTYHQKHTLKIDYSCMQPWLPEQGLFFDSDQLL